MRKNSVQILPLSNYTCKIKVMKPQFINDFIKKKKLDGNTLCAMYENDRDLGFYSPQDGYFIYVVDNNPNSLLKELEDLSQVEKYVMSEEDYNKLPSFFFNVRSF